MWHTQFFWCTSRVSFLATLLLGIQVMSNMPHKTDCERLKHYYSTGQLWTNLCRHRMNRNRRYRLSGIMCECLRSSVWCCVLQVHVGHFQKVIAMVQMGGGSELAIVISIVVCCVLLLLCTVGTSLLIHHSSDSTGVSSVQKLRWSVNQRSIWESLRSAPHKCLCFVLVFNAKEKHAHYWSLGLFASCCVCVCVSPAWITSLSLCVCVCVCVCVFSAGGLLH